MQLDGKFYDGEGRACHSRATGPRPGESAELLGIVEYEGWSRCKGLSPRLNAKWMQYDKQQPK